MDHTMNIITICFISVGLAMDAFAVSITNGFTVKILKIKYALRIAFFYGAFQAIMPVLGWIAGYGLRELITGLDHWLAFALLGIIGGKMIYESTRFDISEKGCDPLTIYRLLMLSFATSIDALVVGLSISFLNISIVTPALIIGAITFTLSFFGVYIGNRFGHFFEKKIEFIGGLILIGIGLKILIEHLTE